MADNMARCHFCGKEGPTNGYGPETLRIGWAHGNDFSWIGPHGSREWEIVHAHYRCGEVPAYETAKREREHAKKESRERQRKAHEDIHDFWLNPSLDRAKEFTQKRRIIR